MPLYRVLQKIVRKGISPMSATQSNQVLMNSEQIKELLPHRYPFLLIDTVHEVQDGNTIIASRQLPNDEPVFQGHFPGNPIYPGVYYIESIAQAGAILMFHTCPEFKGRLGMLSGVEDARFRRPCVPGEKVRFEVSLEKRRAMFFWLKGKAFVGETLVAEASISIAMSASN